MNEPRSHGDERPLAATEEDRSPISPNKATSVQNSPLLPSDRESLPFLPFHVAITDSGLEIEAKIKKERDLDKLTEILQTIRPLLRKIYGHEPSTLANSPDPADLREHTQRIFETSMTPHEAETGMSFFITKTQKAELRRRGYSEEQIREMKPEDAHRALGLID